jgi:hypothetical protein
VIAADLPPLYGDLNRAVRPAETVRIVYEFAARHPEVLKYIPCFCGCEQGGHKGNNDCFVSGRDAKGKVTEWEMHGMICEVCIDVAQQAMQMHNSRRGSICGPRPAPYVDANAARQGNQGSLTTAATTGP